MVKPEDSSSEKQGERRIFLYDLDYDNTFYVTENKLVNSLAFASLNLNDIKV